jgi:hypothetical protein
VVCCPSPAAIKEKGLPQKKERERRDRVSRASYPPVRCNALAACEESASPNQGHKLITESSCARVHSAVKIQKKTAVGEQQPTERLATLLVRWACGHVGDFVRSESDPAIHDLFFVHLSVCHS